MLQVDERKDDADDEPGMWEESFKSHSDSKPHGTIMSFTASESSTVFNNDYYTYLTKCYKPNLV